MTTSRSSNQIDFNHWLMRLVAYIIDAIPAVIIAYIIYSLLFASILFTGSWFFIVYGGWLLLPLLWGLIQVLYYVILELSWNGTTIGKKLLGFQVQMTNGGKVDFGKSFIRNISKIYPLFVLLDWIIGVVTPGVDGRQKYSDRIAGTTVVAIKQAFTATQPPSNSPPAT